MASGQNLLFELPSELSHLSMSQYYLHYSYLTIPNPYYIQIKKNDNEYLQLRVRFVNFSRGHHFDCIGPRIGGI